MSDYPDTPITREEQYLAAGLDGGDLPDPITREEKYLYEIATKIQGGGSAPVLETLNVGENGTYTPEEGVDGFDEVNVDVNPNYVETISGTLGYPWGDYSLRNDLAPKILSNDIDFYVTFSINGASYTALPNRGNTAAVTHVCSAYSLTATTARVSSLRYSPNGTLQSAKVIPELSESNGIWSGDGITLDSTTPCTLTIIHHPLPSNE